jgi:hypothetical protein
MVTYLHAAVGLAQHAEVLRHLGDLGGLGRPHRHLTCTQWSVVGSGVSENGLSRWCSGCTSPLKHTISTQAPTFTMGDTTMCSGRMTPAPGPAVVTVPLLARAASTPTRATTLPLRALATPRTEDAIHSTTRVTVTARGSVHSIECKEKRGDTGASTEEQRVQGYRVEWLGVSKPILDPDAGDRTFTHAHRPHAPPSSLSFTLAFMPGRTVPENTRP